MKLCVVLSLPTTHMLCPGAGLTQLTQNQKGERRTRNKLQNVTPYLKMQIGKFEEVHAFFDWWF